jgi:hypothetical protein
METAMALTARQRQQIRDWSIMARQCGKTLGLWRTTSLSGDSLTARIGYGDSLPGQWPHRRSIMLFAHADREKFDTRYEAAQAAIEEEAAC